MLPRRKYAWAKKISLDKYWPQNPLAGSDTCSSLGGFRAARHLCDNYASSDQHSARDLGKEQRTTEQQHQDKYVNGTTLMCMAATVTPMRSALIIQ